MSSKAAETIAADSKPPNRIVIISALGVTQIFAWGTSYYLPAVLAAPIAADTGWTLSFVVGGLSLGLLTAGLATSPWVGRAIARHVRPSRPGAMSAGLLAIGLLILALARASLPVFLIAWLVIGLRAWARVSMIPPLQRSAVSTSPKRALGNHHIDAVRRLRQHRLLAAFRVPRCASRVARRLPRLCRRATRRRAADLSFRPAVRAAAIADPARRRPLRRRLPPASWGLRGAGCFCCNAATVTLASVISTTMSVHLRQSCRRRGLGLAMARKLSASALWSARRRWRRGQSKC